jgi:hypothetical protein
MSCTLWDRLTYPASAGTKSGERRSPSFAGGSAGSLAPNLTNPCAAELFEHVLYQCSPDLRAIGPVHFGQQQIHHCFNDFVRQSNRKRGITWRGDHDILVQCSESSAFFLLTFGQRLWPARATKDASVQLVGSAVLRRRSASRQRSNYDSSGLYPSCARHPHCLKKEGNVSLTTHRLYLVDHSLVIGRARGPLSPPTIAQ